MVVVLLILHQGREEFLPQEDLEAPVPVLLPEDGPAPTVIRLPVQHADGTPATEAVVMSSSPHFALGRAEKDGEAIALLGVDEKVNGKVLEEIAQLPHVVQAKALAF